MEQITTAVLRSLLQGLGERCSQPATLYLLGGSALCLLGSSRQTLDFDYTTEVPPQAQHEFQEALADLAAAQRLDLEEVPIGEFIPLPAKAVERRLSVGQFGAVSVFIFDPYTIALSKIARGFESDLEDVEFLLQAGVIQLTELEQYFQEILPRVAGFDIDPKEFRAYFAEIYRRMKG